MIGLTFNKLIMLVLKLKYFYKHYSSSGTLLDLFTQKDAKHGNKLRIIIIFFTDLKEIFTDGCTILFSPKIM